MEDFAELEKNYYEQEFGVPTFDEQELFERLSLEIFSTGLSWAIVLRKRTAFRKAFSDFLPKAVAKFDENNVAELMQNTAIVRNHKKILATIENAKITTALSKQEGLKNIVWKEYAKNIDSEELVKLMLKDFKNHGYLFIGPSTVKSLVQSLGIID